MKKEKKLILLNGRWGDQNEQHIYICAHNISDAARICEQVYGYERNFTNEIKVYFAKCWGDIMDGITPERGAWLTNIINNTEDKPVRVL
jgi:hypothetical protein